MKALFFVNLLLFFTVRITAQNESKPIRIETDLVNFQVTVTDKKGNIIRGLKAEDFQVFENGVERKIDFFETIKSDKKFRSLSVIFALDTSGSMTEKEIEKLKLVISELVDNLVDYQSQFAVLTFGMKVKVLQSFTNKPEKIRKSLEKLEHERDGLSTHAYDAVDTAIRLLQKSAKGLARKVIILVTDGFPTGDIATPEIVIERANKAEVVIYSIILPSYSVLHWGKKPLLTPLEVSGITEKTGGRVFYPTREELDEISKVLSDEIADCYLLAFYPSEESKRDGYFREVKIKTRKKDYRVRQNRSGYKFPIQ